MIFLSLYGQALTRNNDNGQENVLYMFGGAVDGRDNSAYSNALYEFSTSTSSWSEVKPIYEGVSQFYCEVSFHVSILLTLQVPLGLRLAMATRRSLLAPRVWPCSVGVTQCIRLDTRMICGSLMRSLSSAQRSRSMERLQMV